MTDTAADCPLCRLPTVRTTADVNRYAIHRCPSCGLHTAPESFRQDVDYDRMYDTAEYYQNQILPFLSSGDRSVFSRIPTYRPFFSEVRRRSSMKLLDIGCGVGRFCHAARAAGWDVTGTDVSSQAVAIAREHADFPVLQGGLDDFSKEGRLFDVITAFEVVEHLGDPLEFVSKAKAILKGDGSFFCTVPNWDCEAVRHTERADCLPPVHKLFFNERALRRLGEAAGFGDVRTGLIRTDPLEAHPLRALKWLGRRLVGSPSHPLGIWMHGGRLS